MGLKWKDSECHVISDLVSAIMGVKNNSIWVLKENTFFTGKFDFGRKDN